MLVEGPIVRNSETARSLSRPGIDVALGNKFLASNTTGSNSTAVGDHSLSTNTTGSNLTWVGCQCTAAGSNLYNATAIGVFFMVSVDDSVVPGSVAVLTIGRELGHPVSDSWETYSHHSRRGTFKKTLPNAFAKVEQLCGVTYDLKDSGKHEIGVIARRSRFGRAGTGQL